MNKTAKDYTPAISIIIPTLNEEKFLPKLLNDLKKQTFKNFEVIHVDGSSEDKTREKAAEFKEFISITTIPVTKRNVSFQRNTGGDAARGTWVIFMDADNRLKKSFLAQLITKLDENPDTDIFSCLLDGANQPLIMKNMVEFCNIVMLMTARVRPFAAGALIGIKRENLKDVQFDCEVKMSEDHQFVEEAVKCGCKYRVFRQPKYTYSLRRFEKEGSLKIAVAYMRSATVLLAGQRFERFLPEYPMVGGSMYEQDGNQKLTGFLPSVRDIIRRTTKQQQLKLKQFALQLQKVIDEL